MCYLVNSPHVWELKRLTIFFYATNPPSRATQPAEHELEFLIEKATSYASGEAEGQMAVMEVSL